jgi:fatty acid desaturase
MNMGRQADLNYAQRYSLAAYAAEHGKSAPIRWYNPPIPRKELAALMQLRDGPAIRDTALWLLLLLAAGAGGVYFWGSWWAVPFFLVYGVLYGSASDSRWHETGHRTAFKTKWLNDVVHHIACLMILREPLVWKWSHKKHHLDTHHAGRDPELAVPRPPNYLHLALNIFALRGSWLALKKLFLHAAGKLDAEEATYVPDGDQPSVIRTARIWLAIFAFVIGLCIYTGSILPAMLVGLPTLYGGFMTIFFGLTQHAGMAEDVDDHRLNTRTVYMNPVFRFLYWNMNYHLEHHMFPMVPYHALPKLHALVKPYTPPPYRNNWEAYREIFQTLPQQRRDTDFFADRSPQLPAG